MPLSMSCRAQAWLFIFLAPCSILARLPYIPSQLYLPSQSKGAPAYAIDPPSANIPNGQLRAISTTSIMDADNVDSAVVSASLPFLQHNAASPYTTALDLDGSILVYTGDCTSGPDKAAIWQFMPNNNSHFEAGVWKQRTTDISGVTGSKENVGPNFLAAATTFAPTENGKASIYTFGGMCPQPNASATTWTTDAKYSNSMLVLQPDTSDTSFDFSLDTGTGQPIAEAGFSMVPLQSTYSDISGGAQSQFQDFLLVGGHTQQAFINMSQMAIFSLPAATWTFVTVNPLSGGGDLRARSDGNAQVEPRSGHTALLTSDGTKVIVFGGWVGDITTPAEPFLAILELGAGYGGTGEWAWAEAASTGSPFSNGDSVYGHGAVMLQGDIMFVTGGYSIPGDNASRIKRASVDQIPVTQNVFYNVSSGQWLPSYDPENSRANSPHDTSGLLATKEQRVGLGVGLSLGLVAIAVALAVGWWLTRKLKRTRQAHRQELEDVHEKEIDDLGNLASTYQPNALVLGGIDGRGGGSHAGSGWDGRTQRSEQAVHPWADSAAQQSMRNTWHSADIRSAERTGLDIDIPSPKRGLRRSLSGRPMPQMAPSFDGTKRLSRGSGTIHVIEERDEDEDGNAEGHTENDDPFRDPSPPLSPIKDMTSIQAHQLRRNPIKSSSSDPLYHIDAIDDVPHQGVDDYAQYSPTKSNPPDGRTGSNLSEYSLHSTTSSKSKTTSSGESRGPSRSTSNARSLRMLGRYGSPSPSPTHDGQRPKTPGDWESYRTAHSYQQEAESLLSPSRSHSQNLKDLQLSTLTNANTTANAGSVTDSRPSTALLQQQEEDDRAFTFDPEPDSLPTFTADPNNVSPTRSTSRVVGSWVGSVRRIIANANSGGTASNGRTTSLTSATQQQRVFGDGLGGLMDYAPAAESRPPRQTTERPSPRRSASDSGRLLLSSSQQAQDPQLGPATVDWEDTWVSTPERREREREAKRAKRKSEGSDVPRLASLDSRFDALASASASASGERVVSPVQDIARERAREERLGRKERLRAANTSIGIDRGGGG